MSAQTLTLLQELMSAKDALDCASMSLTYARKDGLNGLDAEAAARVENFVEAANDQVGTAIFVLEELA
jgi:hypothetical protein